MVSWWIPVNNTMREPWTDESYLEISPVWLHICVNNCLYSLSEFYYFMRVPWTLSKHLPTSGEIFPRYCRGCYKSLLKKRREKHGDQAWTLLVEKLVGTNIIFIRFVSHLIWLLKNKLYCLFVELYWRWMTRLFIFYQMRNDFMGLHVIEIVYIFIWERLFFRMNAQRKDEAI